MNRRDFCKTTVAASATAMIASAATAQAAESAQLTWIFVKDMHCANCAKKIARKLYTVPGVVKVQTHLKEHFAVVTPQAGKSVSPRAVWEAVESIEFEPVKLQGPNGVYTSKPSV